MALTLLYPRNSRHRSLFILVTSNILVIKYFIQMFDFKYD